MKKLLLVTIALLNTAAFPVHNGLVTDEANVLSLEERVTLETKLRAFEQRTSVEFAIVMVNSLDGMSVEEYASRLVQVWGIGKKGKDNGVLLLVAPTEGKSGKVRFEVGYGLEPLLPDGATGQILRTVVVPGWRSSHRANGILAGADAILARLSQPVPERALGTNVMDPTVASQSNGEWWFVVFLLIAGCLMIGVCFVTFWPEKRRKVTTVIPDPVQVPSSIGYVHTYQSARTTPTRRSPRRQSYESPSDDSPPSIIVPYESPHYDSPSSSSSSFDFGGGSSGGGGSSSDL